MYPNLKEILDDLDSIEKVLKWAEVNELSDHPLVRQRIRKFPIIDIINTITDPDTLIQWSIDNLLLHHRIVNDRLTILLSCNICRTRFDSSVALKQHQSGCRGDASGSLTCSWCDTRCLSHVELMEHEEFHVLMASWFSDETSMKSNNNEQPHQMNKEIELCTHENISRDREGSCNDVNTFENNVLDCVQYGAGTNDSVIPYTFQQTNQKRFVKNRATETTYKLKFQTGWKNHKIKNLIKDIRDMFIDVIDRVQGDGGDLGRIIINHPEFHHALVIPLDKWSNINAERVMQGIEGFLNSDENLPIDDQMTVVVGNISVPKGSGKNAYITRLYGENSSIATKKSLLRIENSGDNLCLPTAIGRTFVKLCPIVTLDEWRTITKNDPPTMNATMKVIKHRVMTGSYLRNIKTPSNNRYRKNMATTLCLEAGVPTDRPLSLVDIEPFENLLDVNILVLSAKLCNKFCRVANVPGRKNIYLYLTQLENGKEHFDGMGSISGVFSYGYFCEACLKPYKNKGKHACQTTCDVCGSNTCSVEDDTMSCLFCHRVCRSKECYDRHIEKKDKRGRDVEKSMCDKVYQCKQCRKVLERSKRKPEDHRCREWKCQNCFQYQMGQHLCYQRATSKSTSEVPRKFFFYDFETYQRTDLIFQCSEGYTPDIPCENKCTVDCRCNKCRLCQNCKESTCGLYEHKVFYAVLQSTCEKCGANDDGDGEMSVNSKCNTCGSRCEKCMVYKEKKVVLPCPDTCGFRQRVFKGSDAAIQFCSHIMTRHYRNTVLIAHNAKGFDNYPILNALIDHHGVKPRKILYNGSKIMYMHIAHGLDLTFLDSLNFLQMKLSKIPECFGIEELQKGYFPHLFSSPSAFEVKNGDWPSPWYYGTDAMSEKALETFMKWYDTKRQERFNFEEELYRYTVEDVRILRRGVMKFRHLVMKVTSKTNEKGELLEPGVDVLYFPTIASACQGIFRSLFLQETYLTKITERATGVKFTSMSRYINGHIHFRLSPGEEWASKEELQDKYEFGETVFHRSDIALVPSDGYVTDSFSKVSIQWLEWVMERGRQEGRLLKIVHGMNGREHRVGPYRLDGYDKCSNTAYEFLGCVYHGCPDCFPHDRTTTKHPATNHTMSELYYVTKKKESDLKKLGYKYVFIWEHDFRRMLKDNDEINKFVSSLDIVDRLNPRDSFFGGRTNAIKLYHEITELGETIEYLDYTSLYPYVNKYARYPIGHPTIITSDFRDISTYFGLAKVKVLPPRKLFHPVLPFLSQGKLKFPLCRTCAENENQDDCLCDDVNRMIIGTFCTPELNLALSKGYSLVKIYEVYHFEESTIYDRATGQGGLFAQYVNLFLKLKQQASGFPDECKTDEQKMDYIAQFAQKEGIHLDYDEIRINPGLRSLAKICLNSFWGKFGQRLNMKQSSFMYENEIEKFFQLLSDPRKDVKDFHIVSDEIIQLEYLDNPCFLPIDFKTNIFVASFTTSWARLKLYDLLDITGDKALYVDTDSIIFTDKDKVLTNKLPIGNYLGELKNEISPTDKHITHFVSSGPKSYAYKTLSGKEVCKVRGFSLESQSNSRLINFSSMKDIVVNKSIDSITITNPRKISRLSRKRKLYNRIEEKEYKMIYTKRRLLNDLRTLPFGYCK